MTKPDDQLVQVLLAGGVAVLRTDTIYGIVARAVDQAAVERVYQIKGRTPTKSPIVLIGRPEDMFDQPSQSDQQLTTALWPGKNSVIFKSTQAPEWIVRGNASVAYRLPDDEFLRELTSRTGPLIAPSANPEGQEPAKNIGEAKQYFGDSVDVYVDGGEVADDTPSRLFRIVGGDLEQLR